MASTIPGWDDLMASMSGNTGDLTAEQMGLLKQNGSNYTGYLSQNYNDAAALNQGGEGGTGQMGPGQFTSNDLGGNNFNTWDTSGKFTGTEHYTPINWGQEVLKGAALVGGTVLGGAALNGAIGGAGAGAATGGVGGGLSTVAPEVVGTGGLQGLQGGAGLGSYAGSSIPAAVDLGTAGGITATGTGTAAGAGGLSSLFGNGLTARTAIQGASSLYDIYAKNKMAKAQQDLLSKNQQQINNLYAPGSPEYNLLAEKIARSNAAAGRNSQVGQFASTLAGTIADAKLRASSGALPTQSSLLNSSLGNQYGGLSSLFFNLMNQGKQ